MGITSMLLAAMMIVAPMAGIFPAVFSESTAENGTASETSYVIAAEEGIIENEDDLTDIELMSLTRTTATVAEEGNLFSADSGIYADVSNLTAWNNNEQIVIGGTGRTPIVINNAAVNNNTSGGNGWRSVGLADIDAGITVDTASAFQIKFETTGYENIRFSASQKSTGSGPESFALAYSIGSPAGPYTMIEDSKHDNVRLSNDTYSALAPSYVEFELPAELANRSEVYLRVYMVDSALSNRSNGNTSINDIMIIGDAIATVTDIELMTLTRTAATVAEEGNLFSADSGIYADVSNLTIWSDNTQKAIGGTGRTPIVFNNAQTTGGWKPVSVAGIDSADAFQIKFSTLGYENIRFTCTQKSTGSGPDAFLLAYSIGNPEGPYTVISDSETDTNGIPAITRVSNDTYAALQASYTDFLLPSEMDDQDEVYLRIVFNGLTTLGANGNTSVNDIVIIGDGKGGSAVVNKTALNNLIVQASEKVEGDHAASTWGAFDEAYQNALAVASDDNATQAEVNSARTKLQSAMNALVLLSDYIPTIAWPGSQEVTAWDTTRIFLPNGSRLDASGLDFHNGQLYAVNNKDGRFWILDVDRETGELTFADGFTANGKSVTFKSRNSNDADTEGITVDADGHIYFASERDNNQSNVNWNVILRIEKDSWLTADVIKASYEWDITNFLPNVPANLGIEAVEWVSNADVAGKLFDENMNAPFDPSNYPNAIANGVFFVAFEANGHVYAFVLNEDETFVRIADIDSKLGMAMSLDYDEYEGVLWVKADNTKGNRAAKITFNGTPTVNIVHVNPPTGLNTGGNFEGFAIASADYTVNGQRPVFHFEDGPLFRVLMIGSIDCDWQPPMPGISLNPSGAKNFGSMTYGYGAQAPYTVTVNSTGTAASGALTMALTGTNASSFTLNKTSMVSIAAGGSETFTVTPITGLAAGTYTATVTVSGDNVTPQTFTVSFTVTAAAGTAGTGGTGDTGGTNGDDGEDDTMLYVYVAILVAVTAGIIGLAWFVFFRP